MLTEVMNTPFHKEAVLNRFRFIYELVWRIIHWEILQIVLRLINFARLVEKGKRESLILVANSRLTALLKNYFFTEFFGENLVKYFRTAIFRNICS